MGVVVIGGTSQIKDSKESGSKEGFPLQVAELQLEEILIDTENRNGNQAAGKDFNTQDNNKDNPPPTHLVPAGKAQYDLRLTLRTSKKKSNLTAT